jgi:ribonuclease-3
MKEQWEDKVLQLSRHLGYSFRDLTLLKTAITHRSSGDPHNERLEFLGDSILNFVMASELFKRFPTAREGELTRLRALLVRGETAAEVARELGLGASLNLGIGELKSGGFQRASILADALEAIIGAIYLDGSLEHCRTCLLRWYGNRLNQLVPGMSEKDAKTKLQEYLQSAQLDLPVYTVLEISGGAHHPVFKVACQSALLETPCIGVANSRKKAEQNAAEAVLKAIHDGK